MKQKGFSVKRLLKSQWSFLYAGVLFGVAQIIYMIAIWLHQAGQGQEPALKPISVTTDLGRMFRSLEVFLNNLFGFYSELYGEYGIDAAGNIIPEGGVFTPGIGWPIIGMILGGFIVSLFERETRAWAYYPKKLLLVAFFGGALFSYGTRLAGGCTLTHLMGGIPFMGIRSFGTVLTMAIGGMLGFWVMEKLNLAQYFKHQETRSYVATADKGEQATLKKGYNWKKNPIFWIALSFTALMIIASLYGALSGSESMMHLSNGQLLPFGKSIADRNVLFVLLTLGAGIVAGFALSKSGYGTECALVSIETGQAMTNKDGKYARLGIPKITRTLMRSYSPVIGIVSTWVVMLIFMLLAWSLFGASPALDNNIKGGLTAGNFIGGLLLGFGAVTLIGCEIRSYMRIGLGYLNTLVGFVGFAVGYLPYTLFKDAHADFLSSTVLFGSGGLISEKRELYALLTDNPAGQKLIMLGWLVLMAFFLWFLIKRGARNIGLTPKQMMHLNTEELQVSIEEIAIDGKIGTVDAPTPVPPSAWSPEQKKTPPTANTIFQSI